MRLMSKVAVGVVVLGAVGFSAPARAYPDDPDLSCVNLGERDKTSHPWSKTVDLYNGCPDSKRVKVVMGGVGSNGDCVQLPSGQGFSQAFDRNRPVSRVEKC